MSRKICITVLALLLLPQIASADHPWHCESMADSIAAPWRTTPPKGMNAENAVVQKVIFVGFPGTTIGGINTEVQRASIMQYVENLFERQSVGAHHLQYEIVERPGAQGLAWSLSDSQRAFAECDLDSFPQYWVKGNCRSGELEARALRAVQNGYDAFYGAGNWDSPLKGADAVFFVYLLAPGDETTNPLGLNIGGWSSLSVYAVATTPDSTLAAIMDGAPVDGEGVLYGAETVWWSLSTWENATKVAHEWGHKLGLGHSSFNYVNGGSVGSSGWYSLMRAQYSDWYYTPYVQIDHPSREELGWLSPMVVESSQLGLTLRDVHEGAVAYKIPIRNTTATYVPPYFPSAEQQRDASEYFLVVYEDGNYGAYGAPDTGLYIWHCLNVDSRFSAALPPPPFQTGDRTYFGHVIFDLEVATGLFSDPSSPTLPDPVSGIDMLDNWDGRAGWHYGDDGEDPYLRYPGSASDLFNSGAGEVHEFSYRTNPSSNGYALTAGDMSTPGWLTDQGVPHNYAQSHATSIKVSIVGTPNDSLGGVLLDILIAPFEDVTAPNGNELLLAGHPATITWTHDEVVGLPSNGIINSVDIHFIPGVGLPAREIARDVDATVDGYEWTPGAEDVTRDGRIRLSFHNVNSDSVGVDESDSSFAVVDIAEAAAYPIIAASTDTTTVFAVKVASGAVPDSVKVDLAGLYAWGLLPLRDGGEGEDSTAGDGIYTSDRFQANVSVRTYDVAVLTWMNSGAAVADSVSVDAVASKAKFIDVSANTGDLFSLAPEDSTSTPYASVYFNTAPGDSSGVDALIITIDDQSNSPLILAQSGGATYGAPGYENRSVAWLTGGLPQGSRGLCFADFDNDGDNDFFVSGVDSSVLYENRLNDTEGKFVNVTGAYFGANKGDLTGGLAASWGDYNRDGFLDLFVATTNYDGPVRNLASPSGHQYATMVFRNRGGQSFDQTSFGDSGNSNVCLSGCWVDLDHDGDVELVTVQMGGEYPAVLDNTGYSYQAGDAQLVTGHWDTTGDANGANSVTVIDYDHNQYPDLLVTEVASPCRAVILKNNYNGPSGPKSFTTIELGSGRAWSGAVVADYDLNGQEDYLLLPKSGEAALYMASGYSDTPGYADLGYAVGLRAGVTSGAIAADFNGDHDPDLYLGRIKGDQFQYKNVRQNTEGNDVPDSGQKWLEVRLGTTGSSNSGLIDTKVTVDAGSNRWTQFVDGGSGRGGQRPGSLLFGLGNIAEPQATITVEFPSGAVVDTTVNVNQSYLLVENTSVVLKARTPQDMEPDFEFQLSPANMNWTFKWRSTNVRGDVRNDVVHVQNYLGYSSSNDCYAGIEPNATLDLKWGDPNVTHQVYWDGTCWQHEVNWWPVPCATGCRHRFSVTSSSGDGTEPATSLKTQTTPTSFCLPDIQE